MNATPSQFVILVVAFIAAVASLIWMLVDFGFEPLITFCSSLGGLLAAYLDAKGFFIDWRIIRTGVLHLIRLIVIIAIIGIVFFSAYTAITGATRAVTTAPTQRILVGKWKVASHLMTIDFEDNGELTVITNKFTINGRYLLKDANHIQLWVGEGDIFSGGVIYRIDFIDERMIWSNENMLIQIEFEKQK